MLRFEDFYPCGVGSKGGKVANISANTCNATHDAYFRNPVLENCNNHADCILSNFNPQFAAQGASANVMLGLTPGLLAALGPSIGEISLLSSKMPILAFLLCMGAPAIYPERPLDYSPPTKVLEDGAIIPWAITGIRALLLTTVEYLLTGAAVANVWQNTYQLSMRTVFIPVCNQSWWILCWNALPIIIHLIAALGYNTKIMQLGRHRRAGGPGARFGPVVNPYNSGRQALSSDLLSSSFNPALGSTSQEQSFLDKISDRTAQYVPEDRIPKWLKVINSCATFLAFLHAIVGVLVFSSLGFICVGDAIGVMARYVASATVVRALLILEFSRMRRGWKHKVEEGKNANEQAEGIEMQLGQPNQGEVATKQAQTAYQGYEVTDSEREGGN